MKINDFFGSVFDGAYGGAVEDRTPVRNHATPNVYMFSEVVWV